MYAMKPTTALYQSLEIAFEKMFFDVEKKVSKHVKFLRWRELYEHFRQNDNVWRELCKRVAQILWQLLLPFLSMWAMMMLSRQRSNLLLSVIVSGAMFLFSYISLNAAYFFLQKAWWTVLVFYSIPIVVASFFYGGYKKVWR